MASRIARSGPGTNCVDPREQASPPGQDRHRCCDWTPCFQRRPRRPNVDRQRGRGSPGKLSLIRAQNSPVLATCSITEFFRLVINYTVCTQASDIRHIGSAASRCHQQTSALRKLHREAADTTRGSVYEHLLAWNHAATLFRMEESLKCGQRRNGNCSRLREA